MTETQKRLLKGRILVALHEVLGRRPTREEIERYFCAAQILYRVFVPPLMVKSKGNGSRPMALM